MTIDDSLKQILESVPANQARQAYTREGSEPLTIILIGNAPVADDKLEKVLDILSE